MPPWHHKQGHFSYGDEPAAEVLQNDIANQ